MLENKNRNKVKYPFLYSSIVAIAMLSTAAIALNSFDGEGSEKKLLISNLIKMYPQVEADLYKVVELKQDIFLVILNSGGKMIVTKNAEMVIHDFSREGMSAYRLGNNGPVDYLNEIKRPINKEISQHLVAPISYRAENEVLSLNVFFEPFCGYCHAMHKKIDEYTQAGITINIYPLPLFGEKSESIFASVWSIEDDAMRKTEFDRITLEISNSKQMDLIDVKSLGLPDATESGRQMVKQNADSARRMGIRGTPASVSPDGTVLSGLISPDEIKKILATQ